MTLAQILMWSSEADNLRSLVPVILLSRKETSVESEHKGSHPKAKFVGTYSTSKALSKYSSLHPQNILWREKNIHPLSIMHSKQTSLLLKLLYKTLTCKIVSLKHGKFVPTNTLHYMPV